MELDRHASNSGSKDLVELEGVNAGADTRPEDDRPENGDVIGGGVPERAADQVRADPPSELLTGPLPSGDPPEQQSSPGES
jgi:hypothetical protein